MAAENIPAGLLGRYYAARHAHGHYYSCAVTGSYNFSQDNFIDFLKFSLARTIDRHAVLRYGLINSTPNLDAHFVHLPAIHFGDVVQVNNATHENGDEDTALSKYIGIGHQHLFEDQTKKPAWKLIIPKHEKLNQDGSQRVDIIFISHHAIADGTSGTALHKTLLENFRRASSLPLSDIRVEWPYIITATIPKPLYVEDSFPTLSSPPTELLSISTESPPTTTTSNQPYSFSDPFSTSKYDFTSRVTFLAIPTSSLPGILRTARKLTTTLTSLIHALITLHLSSLTPTSQCFRTVTPISLRRFTNTPPTEICNHISYIATTWSSSLLALARSATENSANEQQFIEALSSQFSSEIQTELSLIPRQGPSALVSITQIPDLDNFCKESMVPPRGYTYELSNIGVVDIPTFGKKEEVRLEKLIFTQCGMPAGPAVACNAVSIKGGPLILSLTWQEGAIEENVVRDLKGYLERRLLGFGKRED